MCARSVVRKVCTERCHFFVEQETASQVNYEGVTETFKVLKETIRHCWTIRTTHFTNLKNHSNWPLFKTIRCWKQQCNIKRCLLLLVVNCYGWFKNQNHSSKLTGFLRDFHPQNRGNWGRFWILVTCILDETGLRNTIHTYNVRLRRLGEYIVKNYCKFNSSELLSCVKSVGIVSHNKIILFKSNLCIDWNPVKYTVICVSRRLK